MRYLLTVPLLSFALMASHCPPEQKMLPKEEIAPLLEKVENVVRIDAKIDPPPPPETVKPEPKRPKIAIVSHSTPDVKYIAQTKDNHQRYAKKHGYAYIFRDGIISERFTNPESTKKVFRLGLYWQKIQAVTDALNEGYDWVMWVDADAVFTDFDTKIEDRINQYAPDVKDPKQQKHFLIAREPFTKVNTGVFLVKNTDFGRLMMANIADTFPSYKNEQLPEQQAIQDYVFGFIYMNPRGDIHVPPIEERNYDDDSLIIPQAAVLPQRAINSFYKGWPPWASGPKVVWEPGDFIAHFAVVNDKPTLIAGLLDCFVAKGGEKYEDGQGYKDCL